MQQQIIFGSSYDIRMMWNVPLMQICQFNIIVGNADDLFKVKVYYNDT